jgi:hypothetical protein
MGVLAYNFPHMLRQFYSVGEEYLLKRILSGNLRSGEKGGESKQGLPSHQLAIVPVASNKSACQLSGNCEARLLRSLPRASAAQMSDSTISAVTGNPWFFSLRGVNSGTGFQPVYWEMTGKMPVLPAISPFVGQ